MEGPIQTADPHIRPLQTRRDIGAVADLIEMCFADTMDADGRDYVRHLRRLSTLGVNRFSTAAQSVDGFRLPVQGFVWEEQGQIIGNLTLIRTIRQGRRFALIANVATHPGFRRQGIARKLTQAALEQVRLHGGDTAWLHVRDDNPAAYRLYESLGFVEQYRRTHWQWEPGLSRVCSPLEGNFQVGNRLSKDWNCQAEWLDRSYPIEITWNLPLDKNRLRPSLLRELRNFFTGEGSAHLAARRNGRLLGIMSWEPTAMYSDMLWLAVDPAEEELAIRALLPEVGRWLRHSRPLMVNYPFGQAETAFLDCGFYLHLTLIWMKITFEDERSS